MKDLTFLLKKDGSLLITANTEKGKAFASKPTVMDKKEVERAFPKGRIFIDHLTNQGLDVEVIREC
jgi:hypothetical protein